MLNTLLSDFIPSVVKNCSEIEKINNITDNKDGSVLVDFDYQDNHDFSQSDIQTFSLIDIMAFVYDAIEENGE